jgi:transposase-like protein
MTAILNDPIFHDETKAREWLEARVWPNGPVCAHCGVASEHVTKLEGEKHRPGLYQCNECREQFTVTVGTVFERSKIPLTKWLAALFLLTASKKGVSARQVHRMLGVSYKSTWFMMHRLREAMRERFADTGGKLGGDGKTVEADGTFVGGKDKNKHANKRTGRGGMDKEPVFALVERRGRVRSHHVPAVDAGTLRPILQAQLDGATLVYTDGDGAMRILGAELDKHEWVNHGAGEYVRGDAHTNTIEGYFSILKRGIIGTYHHVSQQHLKRYLAEFDFRYNARSSLGVEDAERAAKLAKGIVGKRLTYRRPHSEAAKPQAH